MTVPYWVIWLMPFGLAAVILATRTWLVSKIQGNIRFQVDGAIEGVRAELRQSEERMKSDLRLKEAEIAALRDRTLEGRSKRQGLIFERRVRALENIWVCFTKVSQLKHAASTLSVLNLKVVGERAPNEPKLQEALRIMNQHDAVEIMKDVRASEERPFISEFLWAIYVGYSSIIFGCSALLKALASGIEDAQGLINMKHMYDVVKAILPHRANYIDTHGVQGLTNLLDEIENLMVNELRKAMIGDTHDQEEIERSADIMKHAAQVASDLRQPIAANGTV